jgi:hypothetical protein
MARLFCFAALQESAFGAKRTWELCECMSAFGGKADIERRGGFYPPQASLA